jgi:FixJ family two-component response regulator
MDDYIAKPVRIDDLRSAIERSVARMNKRLQPA